MKPTVADEGGRRQTAGSAQTAGTGSRAGQRLLFHWWVQVIVAQRWDSGNKTPRGPVVSALGRGRALRGLEKEVTLTVQSSIQMQRQQTGFLGVKTDLSGKLRAQGAAQLVRNPVPTALRGSSRPRSLGCHAGWA